MRKVWIASKIDMFDIARWQCFLMPTNSKNFKFGSPLYINNNGYGTVRKTGEQIGWVIKTNENLNAVEHPKLLHELSVLLKEHILNGEDYI